VLLELVPILLGRFPAFRGRAVSAPGVEEGPVGLDQLFLEDREVCLGGVQAVMAEDLHGDVNGKASGDGVRDEHPAEVVRRVAQKLAGPVGESGPCQRVGSRLGC
jgi:hypothetical protein